MDKENKTADSRKKKILRKDIKSSDKKKSNISKDIIKKIPTKCGVYLMKDINNHIIYIGKAKNLKSRVQSYFSNEKSFKNVFLTPRIHYVDYFLTDTEASAYLLEAQLVKKHKPRYNFRLKDDKSYPYVRFSMEEDYPRFYIERKIKKKASVYFGPYTEASVARKMIRFLNEQFKIRDCSNHFMKSRKKPCLTYHMGNCTAPCVDKINKEDYRKQIKSSLLFFEGKGNTFLKDMKQQMNKLSAAERFEEAARLRDRIKAIEFSKEKQSVVSPKQKNMDVLAFHNDKKAILFQTLHIRDGAVVGDRFYYDSNIRYDPKADQDQKLFSEYFCSFVTQYYMDNLIPNLIVISCEQTNHFLFSTLEEALFKAHGKSVRIRKPRGNVEKKIMDMALKNAQSKFKEQYLKNQSVIKSLDIIQKKFHLKKRPYRMECFDISHFQGAAQVASHVVFEGGEPKTEEYRKYKIKRKKGVDDFASMKEVLDRRFNHKEYPDPDLLVVDGGKGQLQKAVLALKEAGRGYIPVVAMAKAKLKSDFTSEKMESSQERFFLPGRKNPVVFRSDSIALNILVHLRDAAHRFAVSYHRKLFQKTFME